MFNSRTDCPHMRPPFTWKHTCSWSAVIVPDCIVPVQTCHDKTLMPTTFFMKNLLCSSDLNRIQSGIQRGKCLLNNCITSPYNSKSLERDHFDFDHDSNSNAEGQGSLTSEQSWCFTSTYNRPCAAWTSWHLPASLPFCATAERSNMVRSALPLPEQSSFIWMCSLFGLVCSQKV